MSDIETVAGLIAAAATVVGASRLTAKALRNSIGRRWASYSKLGRLAPTAQLAYFISVLDEPAVRREYDDGTIVVVFVDRDYFLHARVAADGRVVSYAVTTRAKRFRPTLWWPTATKGFEGVTLGKTRFRDVGVPMAVTGDLGARRFGYNEIHYLGNPGHYQEFALVFNDAGRDGLELLTEVLGSDGPFVALSAGKLTLDDYLADLNVWALRSRSLPNTYAVSAPFEHVAHEGTFLGIGVDLDEVRPFFLVERRPWWQKLLD